jgi:hypothetical protein
MDLKILEALVPLVEVFERLRIAYQIGGSVASSVHGVPRSSLDIDLLAEVRTDQIDVLVRSIDEAFYVSRSRIADAIDRESSFNVIHLQTMIKVDVFIARADSFRRQSLSRRQSERLGGEDASNLFFVTTPEDIVLHKLDWYKKSGESSERQWQDVVGVLKVQHESLDTAYMKKWATVLNIIDLLERAFGEAGVETKSET